MASPPIPPTPEEIDNLKEAIKLGKELTEQQKELLKINKDLNDFYIKTNEERKKSIDYLEAEVEAAKKLKNIGNDLLDLEMAQAKANKIAADNALEQAIRNGDSAEKLKKAVEAANDAAEVLQNLNRAGEQGSKLANLLGIGESQKNSLTYQLFADPKRVMKGFTDEVNNAGGVVKATFLSIAMKVQEATVTAFFAFDNAAASLNKATGAAGSLNNVLADTARGSTRFGISFEEAGKATEGLFNNLNTFNKLNISAQEQLVTATAKLEQLGISSTDSAKSIATLSQIMGQSDVQSAKTINQMAALGIAIGKSPQQISQDFAQASDRLAGYGDRMIDVFKDLEIQSKATGVAIGDLMSVVERFQTFEGAATAAGKLNAALGGNFINTMELLEASAENPAKAIDLLRSRLDEAGVSFDEMNFFEKKMIADAAGFKSIEEASRVLSMSNAEREKQIKNIEAQRASQEKLDEAIQASITATQKLQMIMANFAIVFAPAIDIVHGFMDALLKAADTGIGKFIIGGMAVILLGAGIVKTFLFLGTAIKTLLLPFSLFGKAAATGAAEVAAADGVLNKSGMIGFAKLAGILLLVSAAMALFGYGVKQVFDGISNLFNSISNLSGVLTSDLSVSLLKLGLAMGAVGSIFVNPLVMLGMASFASSLRDIVNIINDLDETKSFNFKVITESLTKASTVATTTANIGTQTKDMVDAINTFSLNNAQSNNLAAILNALPQSQPTPAAQQNNTVVEVYIGSERVRDLVTRTVTRNSTGSITTPATITPSSRLGS